jgi:hypothetical protein
VPTGFLERREVRHAVEPEHLAQIRMIGQVRNNASIVRFQKVLQHQASEELVLRELLRAIGMRVARQHALRRNQRRPRHRFRRFTGECHKLITHPSQLAG